MENSSKSSKSIMLNFGLYSGLAAILISVLTYALQIHYQPPGWVSIVQIAIAFALVFMGLKAFRSSNEGFMSVGEGLKIGMGITIVGSIIAIIYQQIFLNVIEPDFMLNAMEIQKQAWVEAGLTSEQIKASEEMASKFQTPLMVSAFALLFSLFLGFVISLISAVILKNKKEEESL
jgi:hypothetical protein